VYQWRTLSSRPARRSEFFQRPIFDLARTTLRRENWTRVRIYAPTGIWAESSPKEAWFECLRRASETQKIEEFWAVFGLPASKPAFDLHGRRRLRMFKDTPDTRLHYLPPPDAEHPMAVPAFGIIIFEREASHNAESGVEALCVQQ
jgi:hypothetical protein